jgi:hypothetical protein
MTAIPTRTTPTRLIVRLAAATHLMLVHVTCADEHTRFTDNHFDLHTGDHRTIVATNDVSPLTPAMIAVGWL